MSNKFDLIELLNEDQRQNLQDKLVEVFTEEIKEELQCNTHNLVDFASIFAETEEQVRDDLKEILYDEYMGRVKVQIQKMFPAKINIEDFMEYYAWFRTQYPDLVISGETLKAPVKLSDFCFRLEDKNDLEKHG